MPAGYEAIRDHFLDHKDPKTGKLRDFLHARCNLALGNLLDDPAMCRKAEEYLLRHTEET